MIQLPPRILLPLACLTGGLLGFGGHRLSGSHPLSPQGDPSAIQQPRSDQSQGTQRLGIPGKRDDLQSLAAVSGSALYPRLARWLAGASAEEIAAWWQDYSKRSDCDESVVKLALLHWTRLAPEAAVAAVAGTTYDHELWRVWACNDPEGALAGAAAHSRESINWVAWGLGEYHSAWIRQHFSELPGDARSYAIAAMKEEPDREDPLATLEFLRKQRGGFSMEAFQPLLDSNPEAAYEWLCKRGATTSNSFGDTKGLFGKFAIQLSRTNPELLKQILDRTPAGERKREMEDALFSQLVSADPVAAGKQAMTVKGTRIAINRLAQAGTALVATDPDQAYQLCAALFTTSRSPQLAVTQVEYPDGEGSSGSRGGDPAVGDFLKALMATQPAQAIGTVVSSLPDEATRKAANEALQKQWVQNDFEGYRQWVAQQTDPEVTAPAVPLEVDFLSDVRRFNEAADLAVSCDPPARGLDQVISSWARLDSAAAEAWVTSSSLNEAQRQYFLKTISRQRR